MSGWDCNKFDFRGTIHPKSNVKGTVAIAVAQCELTRSSLSKVLNVPLMVVRVVFFNCQCNLMCLLSS